MKLNRNIQVFRGLAIIAVVIIHTLPNNDLQIFCRPLVNFAVAMFLFLSGYLTQENENFRNTIKKRIFRVLIPYILWSIIYCFPLLTSGDFLRFCIYLITAKTCFPFYYIFVYIQFVLITPLLFKLIKSKHQEVGWLISPLFIIISLYIPRITHHSLSPILATVFGDICLGWLCFYYLGLILGNHLGDTKLQILIDKISINHPHLIIQKAVKKI